MKIAYFLLAVIVLNPIVAQADEGVTSEKSIIPNEEGWWATGFLVGSVSDRGWDSGFIWESGEMTFLAGAKLGSEYPPEIYKVSVEPENKMLWRQFNSSSAPIVMTYKYPFFRNPLKTISSYILTSVNKPVSSFFQTPSYSAFPQGIEVSPQHNNGIIYKQKESFGVPVHVSRWGQLISQRCTVYLHKGGNTSIEVDEVSFVDERRFDSDKGAYVTDKKRYLHKSSKTVPNIVQLDTFNENICRYAEDAAKARVEVFVEYSGFEATAQEKGSSMLNPVIHSILVQPSEAAE